MSGVSTTLPDDDDDCDDVAGAVSSAVSSGRLDSDTYETSDGGMTGSAALGAAAGVLLDDGPVVLLDDTPVVGSALLSNGCSGC